ncbi:MAG: IS1380 family transposase [Solirubrobacterales bacterium]
MEITLKVNAVNRREGPGRLEIRADDPALTPHAGLALTGEFCRRLGLIELIDAEIGVVRRARPVKARRRGLSPAQYLVSLAETQLQGGEFFADVEQLRADEPGAALRAAAAPSQATARQYARRFRRSHLHAAERAMARCGKRLDCELGREVGEEATVDLDAIEIEVFGERKQGAAKSHSGALAYQAYVATWAERGRALCSELEPGNRARVTGAESARMLRRAISHLPEGHGAVNARVDSGFYSVALMRALRKEGVRFTMSAPRSEAMWRALEGIPDSAWREAEGMAGAEVAETTYAPGGWEGEPLRLIVRRVAHRASALSADPRARRLRTIHPEQLPLALGGELDTVYGYSFIATDHVPERDAVWVEHHHRHRAQVEERLGEAKLGQALRHLPSGDMNANRVWLHAALTAMNIAAMTCDLCPAAGASGQPAPWRDPERGPPARRAAKALRRMLVCVPARVVRSGRRTALRLPEGFRYAETFIATYAAIWALAPP